MTFTKLDLPTQVNAILSNNAVAIKAAVAQDAATEGDPNSKLNQSKIIAAATMSIRAEIKRQGDIYVKEEEAAIKFVVTSHAYSKNNAAVALGIYDKIKSKFDAAGEQKLRAIAVGIDELRTQMTALRAGLVAHQAFRASFCDAATMKNLLGDRVYNELNTYYHQFRDDIMKEYMALSDKFDKIDEHGKRVDQLVSLLPALKKEAQSETDVVAALRADEKEITDTKEKLIGQIKAGTSEVTDAIGILRKHKTQPCRPEYVKILASKLTAHVMKVKSANAVIKTFRLKSDTAKKKAAGFASNPEIKTLIKSMEVSVQELVKAMAPYEQAVTLLTTERLKLAKLLGVT